MKFLFLFFGGFLSFLYAFPQNSEKDSLTDIQVKNVISQYHLYSGGNAAVFNGSRYLYYTFKREGDPFFLSGDPAPGWVGYQGRVYQPLMIFYDIQRNQVVILNYDSASHIILHNELIDSFQVQGHTFVNLREDHRQNLYNSGFFDVLVNGHVRLLAKRTKIMDAVINGDLVVRRFFEKDRFYVYKDGLYYLVTNKNEALHLFSDKKGELRRLMNQQNVRFTRKNFESALTRTAELYDQLTH